MTHREKLQNVKDNAYHMSVVELAHNGFDIDEYELPMNNDLDLATFQDICYEDACDALNEYTL
jgi:hypothetical protein